ncbi:hypothetical protein B9479_001159 [Cryptococcus floricola]|uniref:Polar growth protein n=1 Tax=Cryptococcus floricola TaxID=2591691 RepID=A0A5D3B5F4_9TREE|nr:hypothetical protein B9479_001159 [Cryptococcus floricola]
MAPLTVWAIHTFIAEHGDELDFKAGEEIQVIEKDDAFGDGWWRGRNIKGEEGLFPATYISQDLPEHAEAEAITEKEDMPVEKETGYLVNGATNGTAASSETPTPTPPAPAPATASVNALNATAPGAYPSENNVAASKALAPSESPNGTSTVDGPILDSASTAVGAAAGVAGAAAASVGTVMNRTIGDIQDAIESIAAPAESEDGDDHSELGIGQDARAKLVEQARLANEKRERDDGGFIYSDESDDEEDEYIRRRSLPLATKSRTSLGTADSPFGNGSMATAQKQVQAEPVARVPSPVKNPAAAVPFPTSAPVPRATPSPSNHIIAPEPTHNSIPQAAEPETSKSAVTPTLETPGTLEPAFFPTTPSVSQTPVARGQTQSPVNGAGGLTSSNVSHKSGNIPAKPPTTWTVDDVVAWAQAKGFDEGIVDKFKEHEISGDILLELDANLLKELDIPAFGKRMRIAAAISELRRPSSTVSSHSQQLSPSGLPGQGGYGGSSRGMSAPPSSLGYQGYPSTPPLSTPPLSASSGAGEEGVAYGAWSHGRKSSGHHASVPVMESINEHGGQQAQKQVQSPKEPEPKRVSQPASTAPSTSQAASSLPASPTTPATPATANSTNTTSTLNKRESTGSMSHKRGKPSLGGEGKDRLSFFGRKKPAPAGSPTAEGNRSVSRLGFGGGNKTHQVTPAVPAKRVSGPSNLGGSAEGGAVSGGSALQKIGNPDYSGYMKKKGERYGGWKSRYVVLKGPTLYVLKSEHADSLKDKINLHNHRVVADASAPSGSYGLRLAPNTSGEPAHFFSANEQTTVRGWMKALLKATIERDYTKPVTSSCNIPTIPLAEAQAMAPRPPSPATRAATQRATRRDNPNQLTPHDATILTSLDTSSGQKRRSQLSAGAPSPGRPDRDSRRPSSHVSQTTQNTQRASTLGAGEAMGAVPSRGSGKALSGISFNPVDASEAPQLVQWVNEHLPEIYPRVTSFPQAFASGEVIFLLVKSLSNVEPSPPVGPEAFQPDPNGQPGIEGLFAMMDMLVDSGVGIEGVSINDVRTADEAGVLRLLKDVKSWHENGQKA